MATSIHGEEISDAATFERNRSVDIHAMGCDGSLRSQALELQKRAEIFRYTYQQKWCGVPIIRLPDDIVVFQELVAELRPKFIVETGVARGGSLIMSASFMEINGLEPWVLGIDIQILNHTYRAITDSRWRDQINLIEADSASAGSVEAVRDFIGQAPATGAGILVLDSNHTHKHVLAELRFLSPLLPKGSFILVADTLINEIDQESFTSRPWGPGNDPLTAVNQFLEESQVFRRSEYWSRRGLLSEFRDGIIEHVGLHG